MVSDYKYAFAVCAKGERHLAYKARLVERLARFVPGVDVVDIDIGMDGGLLSSLSDEQKPYFIRLAIPFMQKLCAYDKVVWLDADTDVVSSRFAGIFDAETSIDGLAAVRDISQEENKSHIRSIYPDYDRSVYFNSGVLVMDLRKIDRSAWKKKVEKGISVFLSIKKPKYHDQDILNEFFEIKELDGAYNTLWMEVGKRHDAFLVHYADARGKAILDRAVMGESIDWRERCIVISPRHAFIRPWIRAYFASGNTIPLVIVPGPPGDWKGGDAEYCSAAAAACGGMVFDCTDEWDSSRRLARRAAKAKRGTPVGWYAKKNILYAVANRLAPQTWAWIDDDAEITGGLSECFDYAAKAPGFVYTQFYYPLQSDRQHPERMHTWQISKGEKLNWNSLTIFHGEANDRLKVLRRDFPVEDDEIIFGHLYRTDSKWHEGFCDFSEHGWQKMCKKLSDIPTSWGGKLLHYTGFDKGGACKKMWADKANRIPPAPFESELPQAKEPEPDPIDAVFVLGSGSQNNNEELRYALRSLGAHCKFVRDVYICGECPEWIDKSVVHHIPWPDRFRHAKDANIIDKLRRACEQPGIAKRILFCSDDQFQTRECTWDDFRPRWLRKYDPSDTWYNNMRRVWHTRLRKTLEREVVRRKSIGMPAGGVAYFQPHIWMPIDRDLFIDYAKWCCYERRDDTIIASGYYNFVGEAGVADFDHVFLDSDGRNVGGARHVAYNDGNCHAALKMLRAMFPKRCRFEARMEGGASVRTNGCLPDEDASPATKDEMDRLTAAMDEIRSRPECRVLLPEVSKAEELRLFGAKGWRVVWNDIIGRMEAKTGRSEAADRILSEYSADRSGMCDCGRGERERARRRISTALQRRLRDGIL